MSVSQDVNNRDGHGRFVAGHAPLPGAGRPLGSVGLGPLRPLLEMIRQAAKSGVLIAEAEAEPSLARVSRRRRATAERVRRHRERQRHGIHIPRIRLGPRDVAALVERGFLPEGQPTPCDFEWAVHAMIDVIQDAKLTGR
jgi:hypothetical protein